MINENSDSNYGKKYSIVRVWIAHSTDLSVFYGFVHIFLIYGFLLGFFIYFMVLPFSKPRFPLPWHLYI